MPKQIKGRPANCAMVQNGATHPVAPRKGIGYAQCRSLRPSAFGLRKEQADAQMGIPAGIFAQKDLRLGGKEKRWDVSGIMWMAFCEFGPMGLEDWDDGF